MTKTPQACFIPKRIVCFLVSEIVCGSPAIFSPLPPYPTPGPHSPSSSPSTPFPRNPSSTCSAYSPALEACFRRFVLQRTFTNPSLPHVSPSSAFSEVSRSGCQYLGMNLPALNMAVAVRPAQIRTGFVKCFAGILVDVLRLLIYRSSPPRMFFE